MTRLFVTYPAKDDARFERRYYVDTHLPLVEKQWRPYGLTSASAYFPADARASEVAVAILSFADEMSIDAALGSAAAAVVMGDLPNFTDLTPEISRGVA
jgi:uncharacterized protein (TIGR02118 family)